MIVNLQLRSFASGASVILAVAIIGLLVTLCCYFKARIGTVNSSTPFSSFLRGSSSTLQFQWRLDQCSDPHSTRSRGLPRGPAAALPQYLPVAYQPPIFSCGIPGCQQEAVTYRVRPALADSARLTEIREERSHRSRPALRQSKRRVSSSESDQEEQGASASRRSKSAGASRWVYKTGVQLEDEQPYYGYCGSRC